MKKSIQKLGPGLLFAGAAIGVSHLVQSTRAGADFGLGLLWALLLVNFSGTHFSNSAPVCLSYWRKSTLWLCQTWARE